MCGRSEAEGTGGWLLARSLWAGFKRGPNKSTPGSDWPIQIEEECSVFHWDNGCLRIDSPQSVVLKSQGTAFNSAPPRKGGPSVFLSLFGDMARKVRKESR